MTRSGLRPSVGTAATLAAALAVLGCGSGEDAPHLGPEVSAAMDRAGDVEATFPVRAYAGSVEGARAAVPRYFPEWTTLAQGGAAARAAMLAAFTGKASYRLSGNSGR